MAYRKGASWPPPAKFSQSGPIGFVYVLQMWFRYYIHEFISGHARVARISCGAAPLICLLPGPALQGKLTGDS
jgi:hypothetical protein